jgi:hypothetical protein
MIDAYNFINHIDERRCAKQGPIDISPRRSEHYSPILPARVELGRCRGEGAAQLCIFF